MIIFISIFTIIYVLFYLKLAYQWRRINFIESSGSFIPFSVIVPVRNEAHTIKRVLTNLETQKYPKELYEVIFVDDFSTDDTFQIITRLASKFKTSIRLMKLEDEKKQGKKYALTMGVQAAKYETIITTDADCWFGENWILSYNYAFDEMTNMVAGPVAIRGNSFFAQLQQIEFAGLIGFGAVTISEGNPSVCSGANLGFKKKSFEEVDGYANNFFIPSGDDEFLLFNIMRKYPKSTYFLRLEDAIVSTTAHEKLHSFINQRTRWTSKLRYNKNWKVRLYTVLFFLDYFFFCIALIGAFMGSIDPMLIIILMLVRFLAMLIFISPVNKFLKGKNGFFSLFILQIIYPAYIVLIGVNSIFGSYTWKGRKYK